MVIGLSCAGVFGGVCGVLDRRRLEPPPDKTETHAFQYGNSRQVPSNTTGAALEIFFNGENPMTDIAKLLESLLVEEDRLRQTRRTITEQRLADTPLTADEDRQLKYIDQRLPDILNERRRLEGIQNLPRKGI